MPWSKKRPVLSVLARFPSISSVAPSRGQPSSFNTCPVSAVVPGEACNGGSCSHLVVLGWLVGEKPAGESALSGAGASPSVSKLIEKSLRRSPLAEDTPRTLKL